MAKILTFLFLPLFFFQSIYVQANTNKESLQDCEKIVAVALDKLVPALQKNDYQNLEGILATIQSACGENEFTQRMRIIQALIERKSSGALIVDYLSKNYHEVLTMRWDYAVEKAYQRIYLENKAEFNYIPLNHPIDSLIKLKANALLNSPSFNLTEQEEDIALLFADRLDEFYQSFEDTQPAPQPTATEKARSQQNAKHRSGVIVSAGAEFPITGSDPLFKTNTTVGLLYSSGLSSPVFFEGGIKIRINSNDRSFDYLLYEEVEHVNSSASFSIGGNVGVKLFDNDKFIIAPKAGLYYDITNTGLSEVNYFDDEYGESTRSVQYHNVYTMRASLALNLMRHIIGKKYIGIEAAYHYIPYNWDNNLLTSIQPNYASLQLFFRF